MSTADSLIKKIRTLPKEKLAEVEDFVDFVAQRAADRASVKNAGVLSRPSFAAIWDNPEDDVYNDV